MRVLNTAPAVAFTVHDALAATGLFPLRGCRGRLR